MLAMVMLSFATPAYSHSGNIYTIEMTDSGFVPNHLEILQGDTVIFKNTGKNDHWPASDLHPTHTRYPDFDAQKPVLPGASWTFIFFRAGTWGMHDHLYPEFIGQIVVLPDVHAGGTAPGSAAAATTAQSGQSLFSRIIEAVKRYVANLFDAARQLVVDVFGLPGSSPTPAVASQTGVDIQPTLPALDTSFTAPPSADLDQVYRDLQTSCAADDFDCWAKFFRQQTVSFGPAISVGLVLKLKADGRVAPTVDEHQLGHQIGRQTAESFGVNDQAFLLCPMAELNGGCQHGFFEFVLGRTETTTAAADLICKELQDGYAVKFYFYCYHGVGHGVMMSAAYDLDRALGICDQFDNPLAQDGCWQGVFMENVNAGMGGYARDGVFSTEDPLEPCDNLEDKYRHECYVNHAGYLMMLFNNDVGAATNACLQAGDYIKSCMESIGLMVTNPVWQAPLFGDLSSESFEQIAWDLCQEFPTNYIDSCVVGGIDNIHNFDKFDLSRAVGFCQTVGPDYQISCYRRMGFNLFNQSVNTDDVVKACDTLEGDFREACLDGAGVQS